MRIPSLRLLLVAGGAVVIATAGFAYMASNTVGASSAGEGTGTVSGYTAGAPSYSIDYANPTGAPYTISGVSFSLQANDVSDPSALAAPRTVIVNLDNGSGTSLFVAMLNPGPKGTYGSCSFTGSGWNATTGTGNVFCDLSWGSNNPEPLVGSVDYIDVEASQ
ncbi:MAG: hypothetical protein WBA31_03640 [Candidatus Dormiibacterota bacterium]